MALGALAATTKHSFLSSSASPLSQLVDFFQNAPIALHWLSGTGHVLWANQTELDVLGYTAEEYIGQPIMKFCPDEEELVLEIFKTLGSGNTIKDVPVRFRKKTGQIVPLLIDSNVAYKVDEKGEKSFYHTRCFIRDDTGRRMSEVCLIDPFHSSCRFLLPISRTQQARVKARIQLMQRSKHMYDAFISRILHLIKTPCHTMLSVNETMLSDIELLENSEQNAYGKFDQALSSLYTSISNNEQQLVRLCDTIVSTLSAALSFNNAKTLTLAH